MVSVKWRIWRTYRRVWWRETSRLNKSLDIKLFAIQKHRSKWLRKLPNCHRNSSCNQNLNSRIQQMRIQKSIQQIKQQKGNGVTLFWAIWAISLKKPAPREEETIKVEALTFLGKRKEPSCWWRRSWFLCLSEWLKSEEGVTQKLDCCNDIVVPIKFNQKTCYVKVPTLYSVQNLFGSIKERMMNEKACLSGRG